MAEYALRLENGADTAPRVRMADTLGLLADGALRARSGLRPDGGGTVTVTAGTMNVTVDPFLAWVAGDSALTQGGYVFVLDAAKVITLADGDAAQDRVDTIVGRVRDNVYDASGATVAEVYPLQGTPGAGAPVLPAGCVPLRDVTVPAGASTGAGGLSSAAAGADRRQYLTALGGILPVSGQAERDALTPQPGQHVWRLDTASEERWNGTEWEDAGGNQVTPYAEMTGTGDTTSTGTTKVCTMSTLVEESMTGLVDLASNRFTVPSGWGGIYELHYGVDWNAGGSGNRSMVIRVNGTDVPRQSMRWAPTGGSGNVGGGHMVRTSGKVRLAPGDFVELAAWQDSGGNFAHDGAFLQCEWIRP